ncbi:MAG TPA: cytochrome ubiquinol oxidase subunit I, partial [Kribbella sp.]|nr:cytochrome ubiquinol oxidase subunit I [Kribbella sp.]
PWIVFGLMQTRDGVSPTVGAGSVLTSMITFTVLYGVLAVIEVALLLRFAKTAPTVPAEPSVDAAEPDAAFLY